MESRAHGVVGKPSEWWGGIPVLIGQRPIIRLGNTPSLGRGEGEDRSTAAYTSRSYPSRALCSRPPHSVPCSAQLTLHPIMMWFCIIKLESARYRRLTWPRCLARRSKPARVRVRVRDAPFGSMSTAWRRECPVCAGSSLPAPSGVAHTS